MSIESASLTSASSCKAAGFVVRSRTHDPQICKPYYLRSVEFAAAGIWVLGFLGFGLTCLFAFVWLSYSLCKHLIFAVLFSVGQADEQPFALYSSRTEQLYLILLSTSLVSYLYYWQHDLGAEDRGAHRKPRMRHLRVWHHLANYFPVQLVLSEELCAYSRACENSPSEEELLPGTGFRGLATDRNYLVGYHPHGVFCTGAFVNFMTEATGFGQVFPGITPWLAVLKAHFKSPVYRDYLLSLGIISASRTALHYLLDSRKCNRTGNFVVVVVGGATEALEARPGRYVMVTSHRFGFFKLALQTGSSLIPCISFGEQAMYKQVKNEPGTWVRRVQDWVEKLSTFAPPLFYARGPFPYRTPVNTVVGAPIPCERIEDPSNEQVAEVKARYLASLQQLFQRYKQAYDPDADDIQFV